MPLRLLIVDDSTQFLKAARTLLEREGTRVVAVASTSTEAVQRARELQPDVTLVDVDLGDESGLDVAQRLSEAMGADGGKVVLISAYPETDLRDLIDASPAVGFLPKSRLSSDAIRRLLADGEGGTGAGVSADPGT
jgi:CheY-like chemotaxis protein